jgi:MATE family multidrug resistance protein
MMNGTEQGFWQRPGGLREVLLLSFPMVISTASTTVLQFTDRLFLTQYSQDALAAALPAGALQWTMMSFAFGVAMYCNTFVAQYHGAERPRRIGLAVWQGILLGVMATPLLLATIPIAPSVFAFAKHSASVQALEVEYFQILMVGSPAQIIATAISAFYSGRGKTQVVMRVNVFAAILNVLLDYAWIFGKWGFPEWGIAGAAWATVISYWVVLVIWFALFLQKDYRREFDTWPTRLFDGALFRRLIRFGSPQGLQFAAEIGGFSLFLIVVGQLGSRELAASGLALNVNMMAFMPALGIAIAAETLVGQRLGENEPDLAARSTWSAFILAMIYTSAVAFAYFFHGDQLLAIHALNQGDPKAFQELREMTVMLLKFVAIYCLFDTTNIIFSFAIKGAGDTSFVLKTTCLMSGMPVVAAWAGTKYFDLGIQYCWTVLTIWILALGVIYYLRFRAGYWREMRVIEHAPPAEDDASAGAELEPCAIER